MDNTFARNKSICMRQMRNAYFSVQKPEGKKPLVKIYS
jgi:hypothetical protein